MWTNSGDKLMETCSCTETPEKRRVLTRKNKRQEINQTQKFFQYSTTPSPAKKTCHAENLLDRTLINLTEKNQKIGGCPSSSIDC